MKERTKHKKIYVRPCIEVIELPELMQVGPNAGSHRGSVVIIGDDSGNYGGAKSANGWMDDDKEGVTDFKRNLWEEE